MPSVRLSLAAALVLGAAPALADIVIEEAVRIARDTGVVTVVEAELDDGRWEVEGRDARGRMIEVYLDARSGRVVEVDDD
jgi:uncharacterized membrane protein YkoI